MSTESLEQLDLQLKQLERDKRLEEVKQLKASERRKWITPTAVVAILPLVAGFGLWIVGEIKQYNEGYRALKERDKLQAEKEALVRQKDSLNIEISTLLQLKEHYAEQARRFSQESEAKQAVMDRTYLRAVFANAQVVDALDHVKGFGPQPSRQALDAMREDLKKLPKDGAEKIGQVLERDYQSISIVNSSRAMVQEFDKAVRLLPVSDWARELKPTRAGIILPNKELMFTESGSDKKYYDVKAGRFLTPEEAKDAR